MCTDTCVDVCTVTGTGVRTGTCFGRFLVAAGVGFLVRRRVRPGRRPPTRSQLQKDQRSRRQVGPERVRQHRQVPAGTQTPEKKWRKGGRAEG